MALAIEHEARPLLKLSQAKDNNMVAVPAHIIRVNRASFEWFKMFTCTQQLFSPESMAVQEMYCYSEAPLRRNCELGYTLRKIHFCTDCLSSPESAWKIL